MSTSRPGCHCIICHDYGDRDRLDNFDLRTIVHVKEYGWSVVLVPPEKGGPGWAFTIGLWHTHRAPELAMFGLDLYDMENWLNTLGNHAAAGRRPAPEQQLSGVIFKNVDPRWYQPFFGSALGFYRRPPLEFLQVTWPDPDGRYPWNPGLDDYYRHAQPRLWLSPEEHPEGVWTQDL